MAAAQNRLETTCALTCSLSAAVSFASSEDSIVNTVLSKSSVSIFSFYTFPTEHQSNVYIIIMANICIKLTSKYLKTGIFHKLTTLMLLREQILQKI